MIRHIPFLSRTTPKEQLTYLLVVIIIFYHLVAALADLFFYQHTNHIVPHLMAMGAYVFFTLHYIRHQNLTLSTYAILSASSLYFMIMLYLTDFALYSYFFPILLPIGTYVLLTFKESILFITLHYAILTLISLYGYTELGIVSEAFTFISLKVYIFLVTFILLFGIVYHITLRANYNVLSADNHKKEIALSEIHHRVKNDLNLISSMLSIRHFGSDKDDIKHIVDSNRSRIEAVSIIHELLYKEKNFESIRFEDYVTSLCHSLLGHTPLVMTLDVKIPDICFPIKHMQHIGLILNELILTSLYCTRASQIFIALTLRDDTLYLTYRDDTQTCDIKKINHDNSLGLEFAKASAKQLKASIVFECKEGFVCRVALDNALRSQIGGGNRYA